MGVYDNPTPTLAPPTVPTGTVYDGDGGSGLPPPSTGGQTLTQPHIPNYIPPDPGGVQNVFIQTSQPVTDVAPYLWIETDGSGAVVTMWVGP